MDGPPTFFFVMFGIVALFIVGSGIAIFIFQAKIFGKVFRIAEKEIDRRNKELEGSAKIECEHCGTLVTPGEDCPNCGAAAA